MTPASGVATASGDRDRLGDRHGEMTGPHPQRRQAGQLGRARPAGAADHQHLAAGILRVARTDGSGQSRSATGVTVTRVRTCGDRSRHHRAW